MIYTYIDLKKRGLTNYKINKAIENGQLFKIEKGIYSNKKDNNELEIIARLHNNAVITLNTAFHCYGLLKKEPKFFYVATTQKARKIQNKNIKQTFMTDSLLNIGVSKMNYKNTLFNVYSLERLLVELVRNKTNISYETYQEVIKNYRKLSKLLNKQKLEEYIDCFKDKRIRERIINEVFKTI